MTDGPPEPSPPGFWSRLPLRTQLSVVFAVMLALGLVVTGVTAMTLLGRSLVDQLDTQLERDTPGLVRQFTEGRPPGLDSGLPSEYVVVLATVTGETVDSWADPRAAATSTPDLPSLLVADVATRAGKPYTVHAADGAPGRWRVVDRTLVDSQGSVLGSVSVSLPMTAADATLAQMRVVIVAVGLLVVTLGALAGWFGVRRALAPLREIEATAATIAAGDLTRRVPEAPASTEVGRLAGALNGMLTQVERAFAARTASEERMRRFVADASHELRTPLATIRGYAELYRIGASRTPEEIGSTMARIEGSAARMGTLVADLLNLARLDEDRPLRRDPVDLAVLVTDAAHDLRALAPERRVRVVPLDPGRGLSGAVVRGDEDRLRQVLANLVGNAVQHTPAGSPVELAAGRDHDEVVLEVRDHGPGIPAEHTDRVFERFYRLDPSRTRDSGGAGLGMAIVAAIVERHDGRVAVTRTEGGGTTVRVTLPADAVQDSPDG
ncbi:ATP-binding protein [Actinotalea sp. K2]|uniref:sensor histidine kinase n=1 Tax=Actinotalea sp. K2 TaxID=2939438 RepID=UPI0020180091|nr:ATP-binding protein [Actinotalea sp. K2]MCL3861522.1 HAMP domain-containing histidine kinase [Actinotalea sp. K2]